MAWLQKRGSVWWIGYYIGGKAVRKSLKKFTDSEAARELEKANALVAAKQAGAALEPLYEALSGEALPRTTLGEEIKLWLNEAKRTTAENTFARYSSAANLLLTKIPSETLLKEVSTHQLQSHLDARFDQTSPATANLERKILRIFFKRVTDGGLLKINPLLAVKRYRANSRKRRKPFELDQLSMIYKLANPFWQYMILAGFYSGQRMGDCVTLEIEHVDFGRMMISREMGKVQGKTVHIPITPRLAAAVRAQIGERKTGFVWPHEAAAYLRHGADNFSNQFRDILVDAGLAEKRSHKKKAGNKAATRSVPHDKTGLSFHSLRHSFVTTLKKSGATQAVAKALAGHSSDSISELYTHIPAETLSAAIEKLPDFV
jgi:integrase